MIQTVEQPLFGLSTSGPRITNFSHVGSDSPGSGGSVQLIEGSHVFFVFQSFVLSEHAETLTDQLKRTTAQIHLFHYRIYSEPHIVYSPKSLENFHTLNFVWI